MITCMLADCAGLASGLYLALRRPSSPATAVP